MTATPGASDGAALSPTTPNAAQPAVPARVGKPPSDVEALRAEIAHTRADLGETVQALAARADVKARLQESAEEAKARVLDQWHTTAAEVKAAATDPDKARALALRARDAVRRNPKPVAMAAGFLVLLILVARRRRRRNA